MIQPLGNRVLVRVSEEEEVTEGGIVLPDSAKNKPNEGRVVAVGPGKLLEDGSRVPVSVKVGDTVIYAEYSGTDLEIDGDKHVLVEDDQLVAVRE